MERERERECRRESVRKYIRYYIYSVHFQGFYSFKRGRKTRKTCGKTKLTSFSVVIGTHISIQFKLYAQIHDIVHYNSQLCLRNSIDTYIIIERCIQILTLCCGVLIIRFITVLIIPL